MEDGLYRVEMAHFCAGFVIKAGEVVSCAPILRKNLAFWVRFAKLVATEKENMSEQMPALQLNFDARTVEPSKAFEPLPTAWYNVKIINAETKPTSKNNGDYYVEITEEVLDGQYTGRKVFDRLNLKNENATAQEIAWKTLSAICHATGVLQVKTMQDLYGFPMQARVVLKPAKDGYDAGNDVKGYKACDKQPVATQTPGGAAPSWAGAGGPPQPAAAPAQQPWGGPPAAPAPAAPTPAPTGPRMNPPPPYQETDVVNGYQLTGGQWVPYTPPAPPVAAPPAQGGWTPAPPAAAAPPPAAPPVAPPPAAAPPFAGPPAAPPAAATPPPPPAPPAGGGPPPWAR